MDIRQILSGIGLVGLLGLGGVVVNNSFFNNSTEREIRLNKNTDYASENGYNGVVKFKDKTLIYEGKRLLVGYLDTAFAEYSWNSESRRYELTSAKYPSGEIKKGIPSYYFGPNSYR